MHFEVLRTHISWKLNQFWGIVVHRCDVYIYIYSYNYIYIYIKYISCTFSISAERVECGGLFAFADTFFTLFMGVSMCGNRDFIFKHVANIIFVSCSMILKAVHGTLAMKFFS